MTDTSMLSRWEHGLSFPNLEQVFRLACIYETEPEELFDNLWETIGKEYGLSGQEDPLTTNHSPSHE